jgi:hypothetical protein
MDTVTIPKRNGADTGTKQAKRPKRKQRPARTKLRGLRTLEDLDARTAGYHRARELISGIEQDLGGADQLTTGQSQLAQRASVYGALIESYEVQWLESRIVDPNWNAATNVQRRVLRDLGLERRAKDVTPELSTYCAENYQDDDEADEDNNNEAPP